MIRRLSRRTVLRGAGAALSLPLLEVMLDGCGRLPPEDVRKVTDPAWSGLLGQGLAEAPILLTVFFPHGAPMTRWTPTSEGAGWADTPCLAPLSAHRSEFTVLSGLANPAAELLSSIGGPHSRGAASWATGVRTQHSGATGPTFEQVAATQLRPSTRYRVLCASTAPEMPYAPGGEGGSSAMTRHLSWEGPGRPAPVFHSPQRFFERLFGGAAKAAERASVLDGVLDEAKRLEARLGAADRARLEGYLTAVRELEHEVADTTACEPPAVRLDAIADVPERRRVMARLFVTALRCDLARFGSIAFGNAIENEVPTWLGLSEERHAMTHYDDIDLIQTLTVDLMGAVAELLGMMREPEADGRSLLDRAMVFVSSEVSDPRIHSYRNLPVLLAGRGGGLVPGSHARYPDQTPISRLYLELLRRCGVVLPSFGLGGDAPLTLPS